MASASATEALALAARIAELPQLRYDGVQASTAISSTQRRCSTGT